MSVASLEASMLAELRALDLARSRYQREHPSTPLGPEDPDVRRMIEALAYSAVRTRRSTLRNLQTTWRRLLSSYFNFLLQPLPAMAMAQAQVTARMSESVVLPRGTALNLTTLDGFVGSFQTLAELRIVPMILSHCELLLRTQGFRLVLTFSSQHTRGDEVGLLRLYVHYLDNYLAGLRVQYNLQRHLQRCLVVYDTVPDENTAGPECAVTFGTHFEEPYEADIQNPLERARMFFHYPEQDLLLNIRVPRPERTWRRLSLCFDLDAEWPRDPPIYRELFRPFTVPVSNLQRSLAQPIVCDGTQDAYPVRYITEDPTYALHQCFGVYHTTPEGMEPLHAAALGDLRPTYELEEHDPLENTSGYSLVVRMPEAFEKPEELLVDTSWYQPDFAQHAVGLVNIELIDRSVLGLEWQCVGPVHAALECPLRQDPERLLDLLSLKMKPTLERDELLELLAMFGSLELGPYHELLSRLRELVFEVVPDGRLQGAGIRHVYHLMMGEYDKVKEPLVARFLTQLGVILDAWDYEARAELLVHTGGGPLPDRAAPKAPGRQPR